MKKRLLIVGGHGSGEVAASVFEESNLVTDEWIIEGFLTDVKKPGEMFGKYKVLGGTEEVMDFVDKGYYIHYTLHFTPKKKFARVKKLKQLNIPLEAHASVIHPKAQVNPSCKIGHGVLVAPFAYTSVNTETGDFTHIYPYGMLTHDSVVNDYCTIAVHSIVGGRANIGEGVHVGINSSIREDLTIGKYSIIGMGSVVINDVDEFSIVTGNPAKKSRIIEP